VRHVSKRIEDSNFAALNWIIAACTTKQPSAFSRFFVDVASKRFTLKNGQTGLHGAPHPQLPATSAQHPEVEDPSQEDTNTEVRAAPACIIIAVQKIPHHKSSNPCNESVEAVAQ
jgi:hypothetical protein